MTDILGKNSILYIGKANWAGGEYYKGLIDNYKIIGRALSAEEVKTQAAAYVKKEVKQLPFLDVTEDDWFYDAVAYNYSENLMTGVDETHFAPNEQILRAQFAAILYRMNGEPEVEYKAVFPDVQDGVWYTDAILWANSTGVVTGYQNTGLFGTSDPISREQMAVMMYRYAKYAGYDTSKKEDLGAFRDAEEISGYAVEAIQWAVGNGIISGKDGGTMLDPQGNATRSECAVIIQRYLR